MTDPIEAGIDPRVIALAEEQAEAILNTYQNTGGFGLDANEGALKWTSQRSKSISKTWKER